MIILKTRSEVKVTVTRKWYATLRHPKMYPHTKFGIPTSKNIGDMERTRKRDGQTDGQCDYYMPSKVPLGASKVPFLKVYHFSISQHFLNVKVVVMQAVMA